MYIHVGQNGKVWVKIKLCTFNDSVTFLHVVISPKRFIPNHVKLPVHADHHIVNGATYYY